MNRDWLAREQTDHANDRRETFDRANRNSLKARFPTTAWRREAARLNNNVHVADRSFWLVDFFDRSRARSA